MSISILNRGASGGLKPELTVIARSGSTIDLIQNSIIVATYTLGAEETEHTFVVKVGTYTVRGTLGVQTKSVEVVIDAVGQYAVEIRYRLYLYNEGDECTDITGGWIAYKYNSTAGNLPRKESNRFVFSANSNNMSAGTSNLIDFVGYSTLKAELEPMTSAYGQPWFGVVSAQNIAGGYRTRTAGASTSGRQTVSIDISDLQESHYVVVADSSTAEYGYCYNVWLE